MTSARDAVTELVQLVERVPVRDWCFTPASELRPELDLRTPVGIDAVPLVLPDGVVVGTIRCPTRPSGDAADAALRLLLQSVVLLVAMERRGWAAVDRAALFERESRLDALTGLPNRRFWDEVVDLDDLKETNDRHGHLAGDVLLRLASRALRETVRDTDLVARLGGDEFGILAVEYDDGDRTRFIERLQAALGQANITASVGVAVAGEGRRIADAYSEADRVMYETKRTRKGSAPR